MATTVTDSISAADVDSYDYVIVGGGTAGCVIASRLAEYLPRMRILVIEAGPSDYQDDRILLLKDWLSLLGDQEFDYDYGTVEQPMGNSYIRHSRAKVLGGCSSHNTLISFRTFEYDCKLWESMGCKGWNFETFTRLADNLRNTIQPVHLRHRNQLCKDWVESCSTALGIPVIEDFNKEIREKGKLTECVGFFSISYNPEDGRRSSASVAYIHPIIRGDEKRPNLTVLTNAWVSRVNVKGDTVTGVNVTLKSGEKLTVNAKRETILCAGSVDTPRLLLISGIGPKEQLAPLSIPVVKDIPGVGENLLDHPETIIIWELNQPVPPNQTTMDSDAGIFLRREAPNAAGFDGDAADVMMHCYQIPFCVNTARLGYDVPMNAFCMTPNIPRPRSRGRLYLTSADPAVKPALDFRYFTDPEGYDAATIVAGFKAARKIAQQSPFKDWIKREVAPGPDLTTDEELSEYGRRAAHTVYHPAGTTKMGDVVNDPYAVVDPELKVRGLRKVRIADAGVFPTMPTVNPMVTVLTIAERAAELIAEEAGWRREAPKL
ncbi:choline dehydrogenase, variant [Blastomyces gilchristii SLH14081]|uniref:Choline dehydrogenase n=2 Tax=Blastomyces TaxID=229219 RepID=A0A179UWH6_BLAGS|nr:choline dehydrogenase [Blastomyces gilchristii SLH14081]XP_031579928.1 choline dehydrogenase, variant [Blastomyces gilchristii SLH14081]EGE78637.1 choline dehydrogenase [Blastomyces dermatitidis ATCC 18188]EQL27768.1 choline dehydrogenase [Blastomyces dermatitidis ATCC 26199]EQL27769.1 choline dehydrogenase, variant [Blastomyces dermatitidis ATCC 26199]OAT11569.1 choline dehydrogenase [Blastomyces gilchristii SLH14081]OAT11570.1 choline dehydrogenase, variant [Blastomyces gilchristii SLH14